MSRPQTKPPESYFVAQLAAQAKKQDVAAPATLKTLVGSLDYLSETEVASVRSAHQYAEAAHQGQLLRRVVRRVLRGLLLRRRGKRVQ